MAINPKLEFFRFNLKPKKEEGRTFKDFAIDELKASKSITDEKTVELCFKHFISSLTEDIAKDEKLKKKICLEKKKSINIHFDKQPSYDSAKHIITGVINGGPYGRDRILSNNDNIEESEKVGKNKTVLLYFYFFLYIPPDHNEGFFIIHSNSSEETVTNIFKSFIYNLFKGSNYNKPLIASFCPKSFQDEFKNSALLRSMTFKNSFVDTIHSDNKMDAYFSKYDIKIEIIPAHKGITVQEANGFKNYFAKKIFGGLKKEKKLQEFQQTKINIENELTKSKKIFEWNTKDADFVPVVYIGDRVRKNIDGTPDFSELDKYCKDLFNDEIIKAVRPDLDAIKVK